MSAQSISPFFFVLLGLFVLGLVAVLHGYFRSQRVASLSRLAARWNGQVEPGSYLSFPPVVLRMGLDIVRLQFFAGNRHERSATHLTVHFPDRKLHLEVNAGAFWQPFQRLLGVRYIELDNSAFNNAFLVQGNDAPAIRELLTPAAQTAIRQMTQSSRSGDLYLSIGGGTLRATKRGVLIGESELAHFVTAFAQLLQAARDVQKTGVDVLPASDPPPLEQTACGVCGESLQGKVVYCDSCRTPHHFDCWEYLGACSVYACGEKRFRTEPPR